MPHCVVFGCKNNSRKTRGQNVQYFSFPKGKLARKWMELCQCRTKINVKHARICSTHFSQEHMFKSLRHTLLRYSPQNCRKITATAIPTENMPSKDSHSDSRTNSQSDAQLEVEQGSYFLVSSSCDESVDDAMEGILPATEAESVNFCCKAYTIKIQETLAGVIKDKDELMVKNNSLLMENAILREIVAKYNSQKYQ